MGEFCKAEDIGVTEGCVISTKPDHMGDTAYHYRVMQIHRHENYDNVDLVHVPSANLIDKYPLYRKWRVMTDDPHNR